MVKVILNAVKTIIKVLKNKMREYKVLKVRYNGKIRTVILNVKNTSILNEGTEKESILTRQVMVEEGVKVTKKTLDMVLDTACEFRRFFTDKLDVICIMKTVRVKGV